MRNRYILQAVFVAGFLFSTGLASHAQQYNLTTINAGYPGSLLYYTTPKINNRGQVVAISAVGSSSGYLFSGGVLTPLPGGFVPVDINDNGAIAMYSFASSTSVVSLPPYTTQTSMGNLTSCTIPGDTVATGLNDSGAAVGIANAPTSCPQPFFSVNGQMAAMGGAPPYAKWMAINNSNQVVGFEVFPSQTTYAAERAVQLINGTLTDIDPSNADAYDSAAMAINDNGQFIVNSNETICTKRIGIPPSQKIITYPCRGTIWYPLLYVGSTYTNMGGLGTAGGNATGINLWGDVVGSSQTTSGALHGFLYINGAMTDLNSHLASSGLGWTIERAYDINDFGQIVAEGKDFNGNPAVVLLSPAQVRPPTISSLTLNPPSLSGRFGAFLKSIGTVTLASAAPAGGTIIFLNSTSTLAKVPSMIRVNAGSTTATFAVAATLPLGSAGATITASTGATSKTATLILTGTL